MKKILLLLMILLATPSLCVEVASITDPCPSESPMHKLWCSPFGHGYECVSCDTEFLEFPQEECEKCAETRVFANGYCFFKNPGRKKPVLQGIGGTVSECGGDVVEFFDCGIGRPIKTSKSNCDECPEREYKNGYCVTKEFLEERCPPDRPLKTMYDCVNCDVGDLVTPTEQDCLVCNNRKIVQGNGIGLTKCILETCQSDKLIKTPFGCVDCAYAHIYSLETTREDCLKCPNQEYVDGKCVLKESK